MKKILFILLIIVTGISQLVFQTSCNNGINDCNLPGPDSLSATTASSTSVKLDWQLVDSAVSYNVQIFSIGDASNTLVQTLNNVNPSILVDSLSLEETYLAIVKPNCANGNTSTNSSEVRFRLSGILIEDVVMIDKDTIMTLMDNNPCNGPSSTLPIVNYVHTKTWAIGDVYSVEINENPASGKNVVMKLGYYNSTIVQYKFISGNNWTSVLSAGNRAIDIKDMNNAVIGRISFSGTTIYIEERTNVHFIIQGTKCN